MAKVKSMSKALISTQLLKEEISRKEGQITKENLPIDPKKRTDVLTAKSMVTSTGNALIRTSTNLISIKKESESIS